MTLLTFSIRFGLIFFFKVFKHDGKYTYNMAVNTIFSERAKSVSYILWLYVFSKLYVVFFTSFQVSSVLLLDTSRTDDGNLLHRYKRERSREARLFHNMAIVYTMLLVFFGPWLYLLQYGARGHSCLAAPSLIKF